MAKTEIHALEAEVAKQTDEVALAKIGERIAKDDLERLRTAGVDGRVREAEFGKAARLWVHGLVDDLTDNQLAEICKRIPADACYHDRVMRCLGDVCCARFKEEDGDDEEVEETDHVCAPGPGCDRAPDQVDA